jgi:hypothetical protein
MQPLGRNRYKDRIICSGSLDLDCTYHVNLLRFHSHWQRGSSYLRIGWNWVKGVLHQGWHLFRTFSLSGHPDPDPAFASKKHQQKYLEREFTVQPYSFVS